MTFVGQASLSGDPAHSQVSYLGCCNLYWLQAMLKLVQQQHISLKWDCLALDYCHASCMKSADREVAAASRTFKIASTAEASRWLAEGCHLHVCSAAGFCIQ